MLTAPVSKTPLVSLDFFFDQTIIKRMKQEFTPEELQVVYEDNHVIVVVKPQNVPSCPDETGDKDILTVIKEYLVKKYDKKAKRLSDSSIVWIVLRAA